MTADRPTVAAALLEAGRRLRATGLVAGAEGNLSGRLRGDRVLVTASGTNKGFLTEADLLEVRLDGSSHARGVRPSSELPMHLAAYRVRPDARALVHAHPPLAVAHTLAGVPLRAFSPEAAVVLGPEVPVAPFAVPGTGALGASVEAALAGGANVVLLERHGALAVGASVLEAVDRLEILERVAQMSLYAILLGGRPPSALSPEMTTQVLAAARAAGLTR